MKNIVLINVVLIVFFVVNLDLCAQDKDDDYKRLVDSAIVIKSLEEYKYLEIASSKNIKTDNWNYHIRNYKHYLENIYLIDSEYRPYAISSSIKNSIKFKEMDICNSKKIFKKGISAWQIRPKLKNNELKIDIINFGIKYSKKIYNLANGGGTTVIFEYQFEAKKWVLISVKHSGI